MRLMLLTCVCVAFGSGIAFGRVRPSSMPADPHSSSIEAKKVSHRETVDLTPLLQGKAFKDGTHFLTTSPAGVRISVVIRRGKVSDVLFTGLDGKERTGSRQVRTIAARKKGEDTTATVIHCTTSSKTTTTTSGGKTTTTTTITTTCTTQPCEASSGCGPSHRSGAKFPDKGKS